MSGAHPEDVSLQLGVLINRVDSAGTHGLPAGLCLPVEIEKEGGNCRSNLSWIAVPYRVVQRCFHSSRTSTGRELGWVILGRVRWAVWWQSAQPEPGRAPGWLCLARGAALADLDHLSLEMWKQWSI